MSNCLNYSNLNIFNPMLFICSSSTKFIINLCIFNGFINSRKDLNGGILFIDYLNSISYIFKSSFLSCRANNGGAIYFNLPLYVKFQENCFENCSANNYGQSIFCFNPNSESLIELYFSSIYKCPNQYLGTLFGIYIHYSKCKIHNINYTNSKLTHWDIILFWHTIYSELYYLNSINIYSQIILDFASSSNGLLKNSNFINNTYNGYIHYNDFIFDSLVNNISFINSILISNTFNKFTSHSQINFLNCKYFNNSFINNNIEFYPLTHNNIQLNNCLFQTKTFFKFIKFPFKNFIIFLIF